MTNKFKRLKCLYLALFFNSCLMYSAVGNGNFEIQPYKGFSDISHSSARFHKFTVDDNPYKYSSYYSDLESKLYYLKARYYSSELMRFSARDTYDLPNRYAYCSGSPIESVDPDGHNALSFSLGMMALIAAVATISTGYFALNSAKELGAISKWTCGGGGLDCFGVCSTGYGLCLESTNNSTNDSWGEWGWGKKDTLNNFSNLIGCILSLSSTSLLVKGDMAQKNALIPPTHTNYNNLRITTEGVVVSKHDIANAISNDIKYDKLLVSSHEYIREEDAFEFSCGLDMKITELPANKQDLLINYTVKYTLRTDKTTDTLAKRGYLNKLYGFLSERTFKCSSFNLKEIIPQK